MYPLKLFIFLLLLCSNSFAQVTQLQFKAKFGSEDLIVGEHSFKSAEGEEIQISGLKFYCSNIRFWQDETIIWEEGNSFHLVDCSTLTTSIISFGQKINATFNRVSFDLGIDSITNTSGAMGGDLDPTKGMYWTWQSGYINFKLEGKHPLCTAVSKEFQFHLGGYQYPYQSLQTVNLKVKKQNSIIIYLNIEEVLKHIDWIKKSSIMSPCAESVLLAQKVAQAFSTTLTR
ncbi:MAG: MbnP family protein [Bacteroidota bacterium]